MSSYVIMNPDTDYSFPNMILLIILIIFILVNPDIPPEISKHIRSDYGMIIISVLALSLFFTHDYILAVFGCLAAYMIVVKSGEYHQIKRYASSETEKDIRYQMYNSNNVLTLEEEVVTSMEPPVKVSGPTQTYKPSMNTVHDAMSLQ